ncbi:MAG: hydroxymyristoyl-ACP dehydratase [Planctomycetes bacterium]|nr:hydroxymyristoyl-ACP dehydratase [Planctomycetota bacterium]
MRFHLIDRIVEIDPGKQIRMVKNLTLGEEYLADHFPTFPVMPGVLMLQTLVEGSAWLLRATEDFRHSVIALRDARNVKYGSFMQPGNTMHITVDAVDYSADNPRAVFKGKAEVQGTATVTAKFTVCRYNLVDRSPALKDVDERIVMQLRNHYRILRGELG